MIRAAITQADGLVLNVIILNSLDEYDGAVLCPDHIGPGMNISDEPTPMPQPAATGAQDF